MRSREAPDPPPARLRFMRDNDIIACRHAAGVTAITSSPGPRDVLYVGTPRAGDTPTGPRALSRLSCRPLSSAARLQIWADFVDYHSAIM